MKLYIAEKPSMARELAACLKNPQTCSGYIKTSGGIVTWLFGHVLQQVEPDAYDPKYKMWRAEDLPIVPKTWKLEVNPSTLKQFQIVKHLIEKADEIIHAGDPDREGQLLVDEVLDYVGNKKPVKRILLNALDETSILRANANLRDNREFFNLKQSALARSRADWLIGMNLSRAYTLAARRLGHKDLVLPIGRVKTPTLALVVRREREILNFKPADFFNIRALFEHANGKFVAQFKPSKKMLDLPAFDSEGRLIDKKFAEELIKKFSAAPFDGKISLYKTTEKKESQPLPFSLSSLQIAAGKAFGYSPQQVLDAAQSLYEKKLTTYPRSDCEFLPTTQLRDAQRILRNLQGLKNESLKNLFTHADASIKSRAWNDAKISAHHAIIPTQKALAVFLPEIEMNVYNLIARNYAVQFYPLHVYDETVVEVKYKGETFTARGKVVKNMGWREFYVAPKIKSDDESDALLPVMKTGDNVQYEKSQLKKSVTKPPARFTSSSLVQGMKDIHKYVKNPESKKQLKDVYGIGTEATRAAIIDDLIKRGFLEVKKKNLLPTAQAYLLIDALPDEMTYPDATAIWEDKLHSMSAGDGTLEDFLAGQVKFTSELCMAATTAKFTEAENIFKCPNCGSALVKIKGKDGNFFWGCTNYPECKTTFEDDGGKPDFDRKLRSSRLIKEGAPKCPNCGSALVKREGKNGEFWGCSAYPECRIMFEDDNGKPDFDGKIRSARLIKEGAPKCPNCGNALVKRK
ncbi:MAG: DNA topoisomerase III, partial [Selenomonadaceae bacterium]|nr:DNA topoisomerase III [Selenomonadaceae bacterium]